MSHLLERLLSIPVPLPPLLSGFLDMGAGAEPFGRSFVYLLPHKSPSCDEHAVLHPAKTGLPKVKDSVCRFMGTLTHAIWDGALDRWGALCPACLSGQKRAPWMRGRSQHHLPKHFQSQICALWHPLSHKHWETGSVAIPILQMRTLRHRALERLAWSTTVFRVWFLTPLYLLSHVGVLP